LRWYWLGVRFLKNSYSWQVYKACIPLTGGAGAPAGSLPAGSGSQKAESGSQKNLRISDEKLRVEPR
ncbi:hypothetical protein L914_07345, partial [Phytophthora nicotianae]